MENTKQTKKVVISTRAVYHRYAEVTIEVPYEVPDDEVDEWLMNNADYFEQIENNLTKAELHSGFGLTENFNEPDLENETRFDVYNSNDEVTWGGHC